MEGRYIMVMATVPGPEEGARIGKAVVEEGLAACCNIVPQIRSIYKWKGKVCDEPESLCIFKTRAELFERLRDRIKALHGYEVPEIIAVDIKAGLKDYLGWIEENTAGA